ncbi:hypothetical protein [Actinomadura latina]|uniref:Uncharacterized protein n=1 Tax=Actinomadura latina TaxID=163603 RepID=A0A846Z6C6_9ACTN|nr:hypothetical protein [Actinomadura latina]NKZ08980.1 hypothetical protein [Actinomadura latina]
MSDEAAGTREIPAAEEAPAAGPEARESRLPAVPPPEPTGDPRVDAAVAGLGELGGRPVGEHVEIFEDVHRRLQELLASAGQDEPPQPPQQSQPSQPSRPAFPDALRPRP